MKHLRTVVPETFMQEGRDALREQVKMKGWKLSKPDFVADRWRNMHKHTFIKEGAH